MKEFNKKSNELKNTFVFFCVGDTDQAQALVDSINTLDNEAEVIQCSDTKTNAVNGISKIARFDVDSERLMLARLYAFAELNLTKPAAYIDTDMLMMRKFSVEEQLKSYDLVACERAYGNNDFINTNYLGLSLSEYLNKTFGEVYPYVACFTITRSAQIWKDCYNILAKMDPKFSLWYGDQEALRELSKCSYVKFGKISESLVGRLPERIADPGEHYFLHFKGKARKAIMFEYAKKICR